MTRAGLKMSLQMCAFRIGVRAPSTWKMDGMHIGLRFEIISLHPDSATRLAMRAWTKY